MSSGYHCWLDTLWFYCPFNYSRHVSHPKVDSFMSFFPVERWLHRLLGFNLVARHFGKMKIRDQFPIHLKYYTGYTIHNHSIIKYPCPATQRATRNLSPKSDFHSSHLWSINTPRSDPSLSSPPTDCPRYLVVLPVHSSIYN